MESPNGWRAAQPEIIFQQLRDFTITIKAVNSPLFDYCRGDIKPPSGQRR
jgi:hypothetical protein